MIQWELFWAGMFSGWVLAMVYFNHVRNSLAPDSDKNAQTHSS